MTAAPLRSALFVDFDNVFSSLFDLDPDAAEAFGTRPDAWLGFFEAGRHAAAANQIARAILSRRCYLNPDGYIDPVRAGDDRAGTALPVHFRRFRNFFTRAGFNVVDCPRLTRGTKNSADIVMVMDIIDTMNHPTRFDEFIILSADADFTPVLLRLREHDRRTAVFANRLAAAAYRAASDILVGEQDFIQRALRLDRDSPPADPATRAPVHMEADMVGVVARAVAEHVHAQGRIPINEASSVLRQFVAFRQPTDGRGWLGLGTKTRLFEEIVRRQPGLTLDKSDPAEWTIGPAAVPPAAPGSTASAGARALDLVRRALAGSSRPIALSQLGSLVRRQVSGLPARGWPSAASFRSFLTEAADPGIAVLPVGTGYAYDPARHDPQDVALTAAPARLVCGFAEPAEAIAGEPTPARLPAPALVDMVCSVTECPRLMPEQHRALFTAVAAALGGGGVDMSREWGPETLAAAVEQECLLRGSPIPSPAISYVLTSLEDFADWPQTIDAATPRHLANTYFACIVALFADNRVELTDTDSMLLRRWVGADGDDAATRPVATLAPGG